MFVFIEDDGNDVALAVATLSRMGAKGSSVFDDASRAMKHLHAVRRGEASRPEAVIVDLSLRRGSGQEVLAELKQHREFADLPVIVWTRSKDQVQKEICLSLGARAVLEKSRDARELRGAVYELRQESHKASTEEDEQGSGL